MMIDVTPRQNETQPISTEGASSPRPPVPGTLIPATAVHFSPNGPIVEWQPAVSQQSMLDLGTAFIRDAVSRSAEDMERHPDSTRAHTNLAQAFWQSGAMEEASAHCAIALEKDP